MTPHSAKFQNKWYNVMSLEGPQSVSYCPPNPLFPIETAKVGYCPKSWPGLFTIITLKSDSWFRSTGDFCGRLYRSGVLMSSSGAVANGVVSGVRSKRPRWDYHSRGDWERFCQPKPSGCERHTSGVKVNYQMNSQAFPSLALRTIPYYTVQSPCKPMWCKDRTANVLWYFSYFSAYTRGDYNGRNSPPCCNLTLSLQFFV